MTNEEYITYMKSLSYLAEKGVTVTMVRWDEYEIDGFYKSGSVHVDLTSMKITARYDTEYFIEDWCPLHEQLLSINIEWWHMSKDRYEGWKEMSYEWKQVENDLWSITK